MILRLLVLVALAAGLSGCARKPGLIGGGGGGGGPIHCYGAQCED